MKDPENYVVNLLDLNRLLIEQFDGFRNFQEYKSMCEKVRNISVLKEPNKHGKWMPVEPDSRGFTFRFTCSVCGGYTTYYEDANGCDYDYCPNCGAKMDLDLEK